tara:strand:- start:2792 stop:3487 length:696 start_codon:yes stop_codon:yes gene_type:complete
MRINKYISQSGLASRRKSELYVKEKRVTVNGLIVDDLSYKVKNNDVVKVDEMVINPVKKFSYYVLNKPKGVICSSKDELGRKNAVDLIKTNSRIFSIGRLDKDSSGILILTDDGNFAQSLLHPKYGYKRKYYIETPENLDDKQLKKIKSGVFLERGVKISADIKRLNPLKGIYRWKMVLNEGKNREIRRIFLRFNVKVNKLHRYQFAGIELDGIKPGEYRVLKKEEMKFLT